MQQDGKQLKHAEVTEKIIGVFFDVYNELGHGFLESARFTRIVWSKTKLTPTTWSA